MPPSHALPMDAAEFRFRPPPRLWTAGERWALDRAFGQALAGGGVADPAAAVAAARAFGLAARIAARHTGARLTAELGEPAAAELRRIRAEAAAVELRLDAALVAFDAVAAARAIPYALLKGRALVLAGFAPAAGRPAADLDLLVPSSRLDELQSALLAGEFLAAGGSAYEHQAPALLHSGGGAIELHRLLLGVRLDGRRSATFEALAGVGALAPLDGGGRGLAGGAHVPARDLLVAHALVHTLAQHAFVAAHSGFAMVADLIDLGAAAAPGATIERVQPWITREVSRTETAAALELAAGLASQGARFLEAERSAEHRLAEHFAACATDPAYGEALKIRWLERPLSDRPRALARLALLARTLAPSDRGLAAWLRRPFELGRSWRSARRAARAGR